MLDRRRRLQRRRVARPDRRRRRRAWSRPGMPCVVPRCRCSAWACGLPLSDPRPQAPPTSPTVLGKGRSRPPRRPRHPRAPTLRGRPAARPLGPRPHWAFPLRRTRWVASSGQPPTPSRTDFHSGGSDVTALLVRDEAAPSACPRPAGSSTRSSSGTPTWPCGCSTPFPMTDGRGPARAGGPTVRHPGVPPRRPAQPLRYDRRAIESAQGRTGVRASRRPTSRCSTSSTRPRPPRPGVAISGSRPATCSSSTTTTCCTATPGGPGRRRARAAPALDHPARGSPPSVGVHVADTRLRRDRRAGRGRATRRRPRQPVPHHSGGHPPLSPFLRFRPPGRASSTPETTPRGQTPRAPRRTRRETPWRKAFASTRPVAPRSCSGSHSRSAPGPGEVRVRHAAVGLNFADTYFRSGLYPAALPAGWASRPPASSRPWAPASRTSWRATGSPTPAARSGRTAPSASCRRTT